MLNSFRRSSSNLNQITSVLGILKNCPKHSVIFVFHEINTLTTQYRACWGESEKEHDDLNQAAKDNSWGFSVFTPESLLLHAIKSQSYF